MKTRILLGALTLAVSSRLPAQDTWTRTDSPDHRWSHAGSAAGGVFLLALPGDDGDKSMRTTDGKVWTKGALPWCQRLFSGGGVGVGLNPGRIWTTRDGATVAHDYKTPQDVTGTLWIAAFGGGVWVVVEGTGGSRSPARVLRSLDLGATWKVDGRIPIKSGGDIWGVSWGNGEFLAAGGESGEPLFASPDGLTWTRRSEKFPGSSLQWWDGAWQARGSGGRNFRSTDGGRTWEAHVPAGYVPTDKVIAGPNGLLNFNASEIQFSATGAVWEKKADEKGAYFVGSAAGNGFYVVAGQLGQAGIIMTSEVSTTPVIVPETDREAGVRISVRTEASRQYQPQFSADNRVWTDDGPPVTGDGETLRIFRPVTAARRFYRVVVK